MTKRSKYGVRTDVLGKAARTADGILFASQRECDRYLELKLLEKAGAIRKLRLQPEYPLWAYMPSSSTGPRILSVCKYRADFEYQEYIAPGAPEIAFNHPAYANPWIYVTEDVKGVRTETYKLKAKWFHACYGREIRET